jgi:hypothetical protein
VDVERTLAHDSAGPDPAHEFVSGNKFTSGTKQNPNDIQRAAADWNRLAVRAEFAPMQIDLPPSRFVYQ